MLYLVRYKDGFIIGAGGDSPDEAAKKAESATARPFDDIDAITERDTTFVCFDSTRGWLAPRHSGREDGGLVDLNTGDVVGKAESPAAVEGLDLDPPTDAAPESTESGTLSPEPVTSETESNGASSDEAPVA